MGLKQTTVALGYQQGNGDAGDGDAVARVEAHVRRALDELRVHKPSVLQRICGQLCQHVA